MMPSHACIDVRPEPRAAPVDVWSRGTVPRLGVPDTSVFIGLDSITVHSDSPSVSLAAPAPVLAVAPAPHK